MRIIADYKKAILFFVVSFMVFVEFTQVNNDDIDFTAAVTNEEKEKAIYSAGFTVAMNRSTLSLGESGNVICRADDASKKVKFQCSVELETEPQCENIQNAILECIGVLSNARNFLVAQTVLKNFRNHHFLSLLVKFQMLSGKYLVPHARHTLEQEFDWIAITENITNSIKAKKMSGFSKGVPTFSVSDHKLAGMEKCGNDIARDISKAGHTISGLLDIKHNGTVEGFSIKMTLKDFSANSYLKETPLKLDFKVSSPADFKDFKTCFGVDSMKNNTLVDLDYNGEKIGVLDNKIYGAGSSKKDAPVDGNERGASGGRQQKQTSQQTQTQGSSTPSTSRQGLAGFGQSQSGGDGEEPWRPPNWKPQECPDNEVPESDKKRCHKRKAGQSEIEQGASKLPKYLENVTGSRHNGPSLQATSDTYQNMAGAYDPSRNSEQLSGQPGNVINPNSNAHRSDTGSQQQSLSVQKSGPQRLSPPLEFSTTTTTIVNPDYDLETPGEEVDYSGDYGEAQLLDEQLTSNQNSDPLHANPKDILSALTQDNRHQQYLTSSGRREDNFPGTSSSENRGTGFQKKQQSGPPIFLDTGEADGRQVPPSGPFHAPIFPKSLNQDGQPIDQVSPSPETLTSLLEQGDESLPPEVPSASTCPGEENSTSTRHFMQDPRGTSLPKTRHPHDLSGELFNVNPVGDARTSLPLPHLEADGPPPDDPDFGQCPQGGRPGQAPLQQGQNAVVGRPLDGQRIGQRHQYYGLEVDVQTGQVIQWDEDRVNRTFESPAGHYGLLFHHCFFCRTPYLVSRVPTNARLCDDCGRFFCPDDARRHICVQRWFPNGELVVNRGDRDDDDDAEHNASIHQQNGDEDDQGAAGDADLIAGGDEQQDAGANATIDQQNDGEEEQQEAAGNLTVNSEDQEAHYSMVLDRDRDTDTEDDDDGPGHCCHERSSAI